MHVLHGGLAVLAQLELERLAAFGESVDHVYRVPHVY